MKTLLPNQKNAIKKLQQMKVGALFMEAGSGKTFTATELVKTIRDIDYILWLTPFQNKQNLRDEVELRYSYTHDICTEYIGIETLSSSDKTYLEIYETLSRCKCPVIIVDESLKIKNWDAKRTKRIIELGKLSQYKLILNGTPISRNLLDCWAQFEFLSPKILNMNFSEFKNTFCEYTRITKYFGKSHKGFTKEFITKYHNVECLYSLIQPYVFECDLSLDVSKQYIDIDFKLDEDLAQEYQRLKAKYLDDEKLQWLNNNIFLELTQKMQHLYTNSSEKFQIVDTFLKENDPEKVLIFRKYLSAEDELKKRYPNVRVMSLQSQSLGLNLQAYNTIIIWDKVWDYTLINQMEHRIWRTGQKDVCRFINLNGDVNLEQLILQNNAKKCDLLTYFKNKALKEAINEL